MWETRHQEIDTLHIDKVIKYNYRVLHELNNLNQHKNPAQQLALQELITNTLAELNKIKKIKG